MLKLADVYDVMHAARIVESKREFSRTWLGRTGGYLAAIIATGADAGVGTLTTLAMKLSDLNRHLTVSEAVSRTPSLQALSAELVRLEQQTWQEIRRRCIGPASTEEVV